MPPRPRASSSPTEPPQLALAQEHALEFSLRWTYHARWLPQHQWEPGPEPENPRIRRATRYRLSGASCLLLELLGDWQGEAPLPENARAADVIEAEITYSQLQPRRRLAIPPEVSAQPGVLALVGPLVNATPPEVLVAATFVVPGPPGVQELLGLQPSLSGMRLHGVQGEVPEPRCVTGKATVEMHDLLNMQTMVTVRMVVAERVTPAAIAELYALVCGVRRRLFAGA